MTPDERADVERQADEHYATTEHPPLTPAQRDQLNAIFRDPMRIVRRRIEGKPDA